MEFSSRTQPAGLAFSGDERPIVVFPDRGIVKLTPDGFAPLYLLKA
jgi:hypothetical protein